jgi:hypothetical protein
MALTWAQLQARTAALIAFGGWSNTQPPPDYAGLTNQAWVEFSWISEILIATETVTAVAGQQQYALTNLYKSILDVTYNNIGVLRSSEQAERLRNPSWQYEAGVAQPARFVVGQLGQSLLLCPPPSGTLSIGVRGIAQGSLMTALTDYPGQVAGVGTAIPGYFHEAIAKRAAFLIGEQWAQGEEWGRINGYMTEFLAYCNDVREGTTTAINLRRSPEAGGTVFNTGGGQ